MRLKLILIVLFSGIIPALVAQQNQSAGIMNLIESQREQRVSNYLLNNPQINRVTIKNGIPRTPKT